jgi:hypothetical protein
LRIRRVAMVDYSWVVEGVTRVSAPVAGSRV